LLEITDENWDLANDMIVKSVVRMARHVTPVMEKQGGGSIVNITTYATFEPSLAFLLSDDSSYITGQSLRVDGGLARHM
jgi:NAD(P)-dependent dehydrogenase (short-subunit alcohol dehydrogenase family)